MHLAQLKLRDFRNYPRLDAAFSPGLHLLIGDNAQGKTNILEAIYLLATLRSFRGSNGSQMIRHGHPGYFVGAQTVGAGEHEIKFYWSAREKKISLDGRPIRKLSEFFGTFRAVVFCSEDIQLVKGPPSRRRRFVDLVLAQTKQGYLHLLQRYSQIVRSRNALLKQRSFDDAVLEGFSRELITTGTELIKMREALLPAIGPLIQKAFTRIAPGDRLQVEYLPTVRSDFGLELHQSRNRERLMRSTLIGPHRDEIRILVNDHLAADFASEGQKRSVVVALKIAQSEYLTAQHGTSPVLLVDDIMGELDLRRRSGLMPLLDRAREGQGQAFMTCTEENWPDDLASTSTRWQVTNGKLIPQK